MFHIQCIAWGVLLSVKGRRIVTADTLNRQRAIAAKVVAPRKSTWISLGKRHVLALKGNQGCLHDDVRTILADRSDHPREPGVGCLTASVET